MTENDHDPFELLRQRNPLSHEQVEREAASGLDRRFNALLARVAAETAPRRLGFRLAAPLQLRRRSWVAAGLLAAVAAAALIAWIAIPGATSARVTVECFDKPNLAGPSLTLRTRPPSATAACRRALSRGSAKGLPLAPLHPCLLADGNIAVLPSQQAAICESLGLRRLRTPR